MSAILAWVGFALGSGVCLLNFYLSFVRYPVQRWLGLSKDSYRWVSGFPLVGSLFVALSLLRLHSVPTLLPIGVGLIAADTGGIHWFIGSMIYQSFHAKRN